MTDDERDGLGMRRPEIRYVLDTEHAAIRWFWRAMSILLLVGVGFLWGRLGTVDETTTDLNTGVGILMDEVRLNRAFVCRVLHAQGELEQDGPCYGDEIYPLWREHALATVGS